MSNKKAKAIRRALRALQQEDETEGYNVVYHPSPAWSNAGPVIRYKTQRVGKGPKSAARFARAKGMSPNEVSESFQEEN